MTATIGIDAVGISPQSDKVVVDTSAWIEWLVKSDLGERLAPVLSQPERCVVPTIVQLELSKWALRELSEEAHECILRLTERCQLETLDTETALLAAKHTVERRLPLADAVIYATAQQLGAEVLTCDAHFANLPSVTFHAKTGVAPSSTSQRPRGPWVKTTDGQHKLM